MKKLIFTALLLIVIAGANAQTPDYESIIGKTLSELKDVKTNDDLQQIASKFERIAIAESNRWEALYYTAFTKIQLSFKEKESKKKDAILDEAQTFVDKATLANGDKSELLTLQGFLYQARIQVSAIRGQSYSVKASESLEKALAVNPNNPRAYYLLGQNTYNTPKMFGGGEKNALKHFKKAAELYELESGKTGIEPKWGATSNKKMLEKCEK